MLPAEETRHDDLRSGTSPWRAGLPRPPGRVAERDLSCDVAIVGGGITGALMAEHLTRLGKDVVVIDRERPGFGSTIASTAMLQWEIDLSLRELAALYGFERAADVYRRSFRAVSGLQELVAELDLPCAFGPRDTVYLAAGEIGPRELIDEHELRARADLPGSFLSHAELLRHFGFDRAAAIVSPGSAEADPLSLAHALLAVAGGRGARFLRDDAVAFDDGPAGAAIGLASGHSVEAQHVVLATGYVMPSLVANTLHSVAASFALATVPQEPQALWPGRALVWEASKDYVYMRTSTDGRIIIGGEDEDDDDPALRERLAPAKTERLLAKLAALRPTADRRVSHAWSGAFGLTGDGLPLIGRVPGHPRILAAYGYGGNGITFSFMASRIVAALIGGEEARWFEHFAIDRPAPGSR